MESNFTKKWFKKNSSNLEKYKNLLDLRNSNEIVKLFHFVWIGENKIPDQYIKYIESWIKHHPDWKFCLWTDSNIPNLINSNEYRKAEKAAMKADILRYELLYIFGGVYVDCDFLCYKNIYEDIKNLKGFSAWESDFYIAIGLMGFVAEHPFLKKVIKQIRKNLKNEITKNISELTGPVMFTNLYKNISSESKESVTTETSKDISRNELSKNSKTVKKSSKLTKTPKVKISDLYMFPQEFCYDYTYQDHYYKKPFVRNFKSSAVHMWGNSWGDKTIVWIREKVIFSSLLSEYLTTNDSVLYETKPYKNKIVHIMGLFFSGGIERLIKFIDMYGNFEKYDHHLLYIPYTNNKVYYTLDKMKMFSYHEQSDISKLLQQIQPDLIVDHVSLYFNDNQEMYKNIDRNKIIAFVHSANKYEKDITLHSFRNCIHLYNEKNKHPSWNSIPKEYYVTLGTELESYRKKINRGIINVGIIGRIAQEKIPIAFFKKLSKFSRNKVIISIYGEKDELYGTEYNIKFDKLLKKTNIQYNGFISPDKIGEVYKKLDVLLIPSEYETGSFSCIEALNFGVVVIARNVYGMKYIIDNKVGYLCNTDDEMIKVLETMTFTEIAKKSSLSHHLSRNFNIIEKVKNIEDILSNLL